MRKRYVSKLGCKSVVRAVTDIIPLANAGKLDRYDLFVDEYMWVAQCYARHLVGIAIYPAGWGVKPIGRRGYSKMTVKLPPLSTPLFERQKRCAWAQACGVIDSWISNGRAEDGSGEPSFERVCVQANANIVLLSTSDSKKFDYWLRISTLEKRKTIMVPFTVHPYGKKQIDEALASEGRLSTGVTLTGTRQGPVDPTVSDHRGRGPPNQRQARL